jgi:hypothetical protein
MKNFVLGLDVSTSVTGVCIIDSDVEPDDKGSHIVYLDRIEFKGCATLMDKADRFATELKTLLTTLPANYRLAVEEPLLGFQKGMSSATTITTLMRFNGIVSYIARGLCAADPEYVSSAHARKVCGIKMQRTKVAGMSGKEQVFKHMSEHDLKHVVWPTKKNGKVVDWSRDATDAFVIARAACVMNKSISG